MVSSFYNPFSLFPTSPSQYGYAPIALTGNFTFAWPENNANSQYIIAQIMYVTTTNIANQFIFPPANLVGNGRTFQIFNAGSLEFTIYNNSGTSLATISTGQLYQCIVSDNKDAAGVWKILLLGTGSSGANANALSGYGLSSLTNSMINTNLPETIITSAYTIQATDRGSILSYTGGTNTIILPPPINGFIVGIINNSTVGGLLTLQAPIGYTINNNSSLMLAPGNSTFITGGANYNAIGIGRLNYGNNSILELDVSASINITLTATQSSNDIIIFFGILTANINVYLTPLQVNNYNMYNNTTGGFNITVSVFNGNNIYILKNQERYAYFTDTIELYNVPSNIGSSSLASYWVSSSNTSLPNEVNFGNLPSGLVGINVATSVATPYTMPIYNDLTSGNFFFGANSIPSPLPIGKNNTVIGINSGNIPSYPSNDNTVIGYNAAINATGNSNIAIGVNALAESTTDNNIAIGVNALNLNTGTKNIVIGDAVNSNTNGNDNTVIGYNAAITNFGSDNTIIGNYACFQNDNSNQSVIIGGAAGYASHGGNKNVGIGYNALYSNGGDYNTVIGYNAFRGSVNGNFNVAIGTNAGSSYNNNNSCIFIGNESDASVGNLTNAIAFGANAKVLNSNTIILGAPGTVVGVNTLANLVVTANSGSNGTVGVVTLNGTINVTINTTACLTTSLIIPIPLTNETPEYNGVISVNNITNGSFNIVSTNALDHSVCYWFVVNPI
jgi:hypothetical protein